MEMISEPLSIWNQFKEHLCDDLSQDLARRGVNLTSLVEPHIDYRLYLLGVGVTDLGKTLTDFNLPLYQYDWPTILPYVDRGLDPVLETALADRLICQLNTD
jgi:hypothetical protein